MVENGKDKSEQKGKAKKQKMMFIVVGVAIIAVVALLLLLTSEQPDPYTEVNEVLKDTSKYEGKSIELAGTVGEIYFADNNSIGIRFELKDRELNEKMIWVESVNPAPEGFTTGKDVVVTGTLDLKDGDYVIEADDIQVGCPSKYE
jgi:cytochrome c-type biogenesis protein CcmE